MEKKGVSPVVGTILLIAITVALAAIVAMLVSGLGGRGAPPSAMLTVTAKDNNIIGSGIDINRDNLLLTIKHEGGDDLVISDLKIQVIDNAGNVYDSDVISQATGTFSVGQTLTANYTLGNSTIGYSTKGTAIAVNIIHVPSKQKLFSNSTVIVT